MNTLNSKQSLFSLVIMALIAVLTNGCALTEDMVAINYIPNQNVEKISGAELVNVSINLTDTRTIKDKISSKKNGYGMEMAAIKAENDITMLVSSAIEDELLNRGFKLQNGDMIVNTELNKIYNDFKIGLWSGTATSEVVLNVQVKNNDGNIVYVKTINGSHNETGILIMNGKNAKISIEKSLQIAIVNLMKDESFIAALLKVKN